MDITNIRAGTDDKLASLRGELEATRGERRSIEESVHQFVRVSDSVTLIRDVGLSNVLAQLTTRIEADFRRWPDFEKVPRLASHSRDGVIELMPASEATLFSFKYVNGHPTNAAGGLQTVAAFGVLADVAKRGAGSRNASRSSPST